MPSLRHLEAKYPIINSNFQQFCVSHGIYTVEDFLLHDVYVLVGYAERQPASNELKQGITQILSIIDTQHQPWLNGVELLEDAQRNKHVLSTGYQGIDSLLGGGLHIGHITELAGPSSSGKTQICLRTASNVAHNYNGGVMFLDTSNSFSSKRVASCIDQLLDPSMRQDTHKILERTMSNILCHSVFDIFGLLDVLHHLEFKLRSQSMSADSQLRLLIIDSFSSLITPILGGNGPHGHSLMISAGFLLKKLAFEHNLAVLVTNHTVGGDGGSSKPALGESWKSVPHVRLFLSRERGNNTCNLFVLKHPCIASGNAAKVMMYD